MTTEIATKIATQGEALPQEIGINARNHAKHFAKMPKTCMTRELFNFCEQNDILLAKSVLNSECGWLFIPGSGIKTVMELNYDVPSVLFLHDRASRNDQLDVMQCLNGRTVAGGAL